MVRLLSAGFGRSLRTLTVACIGAAGVVGSLATPVLAAPPGPSELPAIVGFVRDACSGLPVAGAIATLSSGTGAVPPGPADFGGAFVYPTLAPGSYVLAVTAPGYQPLGGRGLPGTVPGLNVTIPPGPADRSWQATLGLSLRLIPLYPPDPCVPPGPSGLPALVGQVVSACNGAPILGATVTIPPGPGDKGGLPAVQRTGFFGGFLYGSLPAGVHQLLVSAPGYQPLGGAGVPGVAPGIQVTIPPGPNDFSAATLALAVRLTPIGGCAPPGPND